MEHPEKRGFTLIELLVVIGIVAVLAVAVILVLNPAELLRQSRDSTRFTDMQTLNRAVALYGVQTQSPSFGTSSLNFLSVPSGHARCSGSVCNASAANLRRIDGTGWVPVNLASLGSLTPISSLPVDPINDSGPTAGTAFMYIYLPTSDGTWSFATMVESNKNKVNGYSIPYGYIRFFPHQTSLPD